LSALAGVEPHSNYFLSEAHYESPARRIFAVSSGGGRFVLVTGDPPADSKLLSQALGNVAGASYEVIDIRCGPELTGKGLKRAAPARSAPTTTGGAVLIPEGPVTAASYFPSLTSTIFPIGRLKTSVKAYWMATGFRHQRYS
jgi:hypothetical protein